MRTLLTALTVLLATASPAQAQGLSRTAAYLKAWDVLEQQQIAYLYDRDPILGWQLQPARECERLDGRRVRCAFVVQRSTLERCGGTITLIRRSWYVGWRISAHPSPDAPCDPKAARAAQGQRGYRAISF